MRDDGPGVAEALRHRIFDPFFTTKGPERGTGLGSSIAFDIVREHGGVLGIAPDPRRRCVFRGAPSGSVRRGSAAPTHALLSGSRLCHACPAMDDSDEFVALRVSRRRAQVDEWVLVLSAEGLPSRVQAGPAGFVLEVAAGDARGRRGCADPLAAGERAHAEARRTRTARLPPDPPRARRRGLPARALRRNGTRGPLRLGVRRARQCGRGAHPRGRGVARRHRPHPARRLRPRARQRDGRDALPVRGVPRLRPGRRRRTRARGRCARQSRQRLRPGALPMRRSARPPPFSVPSACWPAARSHFGAHRCTGDPRGCRSARRSPCSPCSAPRASASTCGRTASDSRRGSCWARWLPTRRLAGLASPALQALAGASALAALAIAWALALHA